MSYGISFKAATKQAALEAIAAQVESILKTQPEHSVDVPKVADVLRSAVDGLALKDGQAIQCNSYGSISRTYPTAGPSELLAVSATINISTVFEKPTEAA
jgi:hypothetical protein